MCSWGARSSRRLGHLYCGMKPFRPFRSQPYPGQEERKDPQHETESYKNLEQTDDDFSNTTEYKTYEPSPHEADVASLKDGDEHRALYQRFYQHFYGDRAKQPADCVVISSNRQQLDYAKSLGHCLQERGLKVEMLYLQTESGLTRALKDVRSNVNRNMPREQVLDLVMVECRRTSGAWCQCDPTKAAARASELTDDYLERAKLERHAVPPAMRHLLLLMAEGLHLYPEELDSIIAYVRNRQDHLQASSPEVDGTAAPEINSAPTRLGNPPPLLSTPVRTVPALNEHPTTSSGKTKPTPGHPLSSPDLYPKTKPPPLLSLNIVQGSLHGPTPHDPPPPHGPTGTQGPSTSHGHPPLHGPSASETCPVVHGPPPLQSPPASNVQPKPHAYGPSPHHGHPASHSSSSSQNPQTKRSPTVPTRPSASHGAHPPRPHGPYDGAHVFRIGGAAPCGPRVQNGSSGLRAPPPLLRNLP